MPELTVYELLDEAVPGETFSELCWRVWMENLPEDLSEESRMALIHWKIVDEVENSLSLRGILRKVWWWVALYWRL